MRPRKGGIAPRTTLRRRSLKRLGVAACLAALSLAAICMCVGALGATPTSAATFSNPASIAIPSSGTANPYPSNITVSGLGPSAGDVNATLSGLNHTFPADLDVLLVSPTGQSVVLMSDVPRDLPYCDNSAVGVNLTFDDAAAPIPPGLTLASGTYQPTNNASTEPGCGMDPDAFAGPAPGGPYGSTLAVFDNRNPNGTWSLYVVDDIGPDSGSLANGWSLDINPSNVFTLGATTRNKKKGTATLTVNLPNPGDLTGSGNGAKVASAGALTSKAVPVGTATLLVKAKGKKKRKLNDTGKVKLALSVVYTPTGGNPSTQSIKVKLKKKL